MPKTAWIVDVSVPLIEEEKSSNSASGLARVLSTVGKKLLFGVFFVVSARSTIEVGLQCAR